MRQVPVKEIARREGIDDSYVSGIGNLITIVPDIVAAILDATLSSEVTLFELAAGTPLLWEEQRGGGSWFIQRRTHEPQLQIIKCRFFSIFMA